MARKPLAALPLALTAWIALSAPAWAGVRTFPFTYPYDNPEAGERELELWTLYIAANQYLRNQLGLAYGVTDNLSVLLFGVFSNLHTDARRLRGLKVQSRYRFGKKDELPLDAGILLEYEHPLAAGVSGEVGGRLLLEKTLGSFAIASNLTAEKDLEATKPFEFGATLGGAYVLNAALKLGVESRITRIGAGTRAAIGPTVSLNIGGSRLVGGVYFGGNRVQVLRLILTQSF